MANADVYALVALPQNLSKYDRKVLTIDQVILINTYYGNIIGCDQRVLFDAGEFTGISFYKNINLRGKYSVFALQNDLKRGPEYYITDYLSMDGRGPNTKLRNIVIDYINNHKELGLNIDNFL